VSTPEDPSPANEGGTVPAGPHASGAGRTGASRRSPSSDARLDQAADDSDVGWGEDARSSVADERLLRERPPHWE
jgi:hypothetical protein